MFCKILEQRPALCRELLELVLDRKVGALTGVNPQKPIEIIANGKGVRFDVYAEGSDSVIYEIEMQNASVDSIAKRSRYSQGMIDLNLIKRGPGERRRFIDSALCREKLQNAVILSKYNRMLIQRNALLKDVLRKPELEDTLEIWDEQLTRYGAMLTRRRLDYVQILSKRAARFHKGISGGKEKLEIRYVSTADAVSEDSERGLEQKLADKFRQNRKNDVKLGATLAGPHRDDIEILINGKNAKSFASQGQQRSAVLSLKLAEAAVLKERMGEEPVILLDDVLSELDNGRQDFLLNELKDCQVFITCCERSNKEQLKNGKIFFVENGVIS